MSMNKARLMVLGRLLGVQHFAFCCRQFVNELR